ncbi:MAG: ribonuclease P protein component [Christensenellaceae bacterium]|nr:ribonuclease P protein component [Christensenellaceae bacterium]
MKRCYSLKRNKEFRYAYRVGKAAHSKSMVLIYAKGKPNEVKIGFSVSKKLGNAVVRNRIKRRLREAITPLIPDFRKGVKLIIVAKAAILEEKMQSIQSSMRYMAKKAGLLTHGDDNACGDNCTHEYSTAPINHDSPGAQR